MFKLGTNFNPFNEFYHSGPNVFLKRLFSDFKKNKSFITKSGLLPNFDVGLYLIKKGKYDYNKPFFLRNGGIHFDSKDTIGGKKINDQIFSSAEKSKGIIFITEFCKKLFFKFYNMKRKVPTTVIRNAVPLNKFNPEGVSYRENLGFSDNDKVIISSANWRRHKRLDETIKFINMMNSKYNNIYKLIVLGKHNLKIKNNNIHFTGEISPDSLPAWYRTGDMFLHLSWIEPGCNTQIEAMACGLPTLCCNNGGIGENVNLNNSGIVANVDEDYDFKEIDFYNPPEPNYINLEKNLIEIFKNLNEIKKNIKYENLDIGKASKQYEQFIKKNI